ncbi:hypothetical protein NE237_014815 [Protea cynaroides]|uniref:Uncharacterized protein n=1 Tax=Protea cynaroides TaxID=273540 RepID=A0A9Q0QQM4_9MAGN|nr:hypothetical protein NE237_014815 [Protea cynaroides]
MGNRGMLGLVVCGLMKSIVPTVVDMMQDFKIGYLTLSSEKSVKARHQKIWLYLEDLARDKLVAVCEPYGFHLLMMGRRSNGSIVFSFETRALDLIEVHPGEVLVVDKSQIQSMCLLVVGLWFLWRRRKIRRKKKILVKVVETNTICVICGELVGDQISFILAFLYLVVQLLVVVVTSLLLRLCADGKRSMGFSVAYGVSKLNGFILEPVMTFGQGGVEGCFQLVLLRRGRLTETLDRLVQLSNACVVHHPVDALGEFKNESTKYCYGFASFEDSSPRKKMEK